MSRAALPKLPYYHYGQVQLGEHKERVVLGPAARAANR